MDSIFECRRCSYRGGKRSAMWHVIRTHVDLERVPYHCSLCEYRAPRLRQLRNHVSGYQPHQRRKVTCPSITDESFLVVATNPYIVTWSTGIQDSTDLRVVPGAGDVVAEAMKRSGVKREACEETEDFQPNYEEVEDVNTSLREEISDLKRNGLRMLEENEALRENTAKLERDLKNSEKVVQENENLKKLNNTISAELNKLVREKQRMKEEMSRLRVAVEVIPSVGVVGPEALGGFERLWSNCPCRGITGYLEDAGRPSKVAVQREQPRPKREP